MLCLCTESFSASYNDIILSELTVLLTEATITFLAQMVINNTFESTEADRPISHERETTHSFQEKTY